MREDASTAAVYVLLDYAHVAAAVVAAVVVAVVVVVVGRADERGDCAVHAAASACGRVVVAAAADVGCAAAVGVAIGCVGAMRAVVAGFVVVVAGVQPAHEPEQCMRVACVFLVLQGK